METTANQANSKRKEPALQLKRTLLPIETYAAREGVSKDIVEECGRLGIVQIRKCRGKVFVVDTPLSPYSVFTKPDNDENNEPYDDNLDENTLDDIFNHDHTEISETTDVSTLLGDKDAFAQKITQLTQKVIDDTPQAKHESSQSDYKFADIKKILSLTKKMLHKIWPIKGKTAEDSNDDDKQYKNITEPAQNIQADKLKLSDAFDRLAPLSIKAKKIFELIKGAFHSKVFTKNNEISDDAKQQDLEDENLSEPERPEACEMLEIIDEPTAPAEQQKYTEDSSELIHTPDLQELKIVEEDAPIETIDDETIQTESFLGFKQTPQNYEFQFGVLSTQAKSKRIWQALAISSMMFLFIAVLFSLWLYMDRKVQFDRLDQYGASIQKVYEDSMQANRKVETLQNELAGSKAEIERLTSELDNSRADVKSLKAELDDSRQRIETIQQRNSKAVEQLNDQIQRLTNRLPGVTESH